MKITALAALLLLSACATPSASGLAEGQPKRIYQSAKARPQIVDCLLNRMGGPRFRPEVREGPAETTVGLASYDQWTSPGTFLFTVRDAPHGSLIEARTYKGFVKSGLPTAETCF